VVLADNHLLEEFYRVVLNIPGLNLLLLENGKLNPSEVIVVNDEHAEPYLVIFCLRDDLKALLAFIWEADVYDLV
jgi:hypothetical protein